jgi:hypothetical protein
MRCLSRHVKAWPLVACLCVPSLLAASTSSAWAQGRAKKTAPAKNVAPADDGNLQNTLSWEDKVMGPETNKKIDLKKIEELQAKEKARREKAEKDDKERREREAAQAAQRKDVAAPATKEVEVEEAPVPVKPAVKHDDAFVDKLMNDKGGPKKKVSQGPDDVDQLLAKVKDNKGGAPAAKKNDSVDQLLTSAEKQPTRTTVTRPSPALQTTKSDEEAAREEALRALAAAQAKLAADRAKQRQQPAVPDAAVLKARMAAENGEAAAPAPKKAAPTLTTTSTPASASSDSWSDPFTTTDSPRGHKGALKHGKGPANGAKGGWGDPFDSGGGKARPGGKAAGKGQKKTKDPNWSDPFA